MRFLYYFLQGDSDGKIQSLVIGGVLATMGFIALLIGLVADLIAFNRQLLEAQLEKIRRLENAVAELTEERRQREADGGSGRR